MELGKEINSPSKISSFFNISKLPQLFWAYALHFQQLIVVLAAVERIPGIAKVVKHRIVVEPWKERAIRPIDM